MDSYEIEDYLESIDTVGGALSINPMIKDDRLYALIEFEGQRKWLDFQARIEMFYTRDPKSKDYEAEADKKLMALILESLSHKLQKGT